jgi:glucokinase
VSEPVAVGIDVGGTKLVAATIASDGRVLDRYRRETPASDERLLVRTVRELIASLGSDLPVGLGIAGLVTPSGEVRYGPNIGIREAKLREQLDDATSATVWIVNDASAAALGEQRVGAGRDHDDVVLFTLGTGVGGGLVVNGQLVVGTSGFGGELGHVIVNEGGRACPCGNRGCVEAYASGSAIGLMARERLVDLSVESELRATPTLDGREVTQAALAGDRFAQSILDEVGHWLGVAAASMVNALDPDIVLVGGGAALKTSRFVLTAARASMAERLVGSGWRTPPPIELAALGDDAGMVGAALYAADRHQQHRHLRGTTT